MTRPLPSSRLSRRLATAAALALALGVFVSAAAAERPAHSKLKLPTERTSSTGNFFTLEAYDPATSAHDVANFEMKVCTSAHTPNPTAIDPAFFTLGISHGATVPESVSIAKSPALAFKPLKPLQCAEGWLGFVVPKGQTAVVLHYTHNGTISWELGG
jgi:hypothetical protein